MGLDAWTTLAVLAVVIGLLIFTRIAADVVLLGGLTLLMVIPVPTEVGWQFGVLSASEALSGLSNPGLVTVGVLFIVVAGLCGTGGVDWLGQRLLGRPRTLVGAQLRIMGPVAGLIGGAFSPRHRPLGKTAIIEAMRPVLVLTTLGRGWLTVRAGFSSSRHHARARNTSFI